MYKNIFKTLIIFLSLICAKSIPIQEIKLKGLITNPKQEISGMDWYKDNLFFLPENLGGHLFRLTKKEIQEAINIKHSKTLLPIKTKLITPDYSKTIPGFDGFEAIAFNKNKVYLTIEAENNDTMEGYIVWGTINPKSYEINIKSKNIKKIQTPIQIDNLSFESIIINDNNALILYESNGINLRKNPFQILIGLNDFVSKKIKAPNIEYRITDGTKLKNNQFWAINYYWPGDKNKLNPGIDNLLLNNSKKFNNDQTVERLIEFIIKDDKLMLTNKKPINLILEDGKSRNWEGIVRYGESGFLIATDKHPRMILAYVNID
ncbi:MAG: hypothetical protein CMG55_00650 [Candidatus Marinimicrobia bacterium]|nr:hypothetical protein [Candidatus Neomarinimicrobiota bacterium]|tara:strand:+ start:6279 stop:7235 length:957 start_codon:yes stop_codon:yes gene_type:complete